MTSHDLTRRTFGGATLLGAAAPLLVACGSDEESPGAAPTGDGPLVATSDVPVGGGVVVKDAQVVVTQPSDGDFKCFTAICTHEGCVVGSVEDGEIKCPCHGSAFSVEDGSVVSGPAEDPLDEVQVTVDGGQVTRS
jgi:Rieske Fe-S protein